MEKKKLLAMAESALGKDRLQGLLKQTYPDADEGALLNWCYRKAAASHDPGKAPKALQEAMAISLLQRCGSRPRTADWERYAAVYPAVQKQADAAQKRDEERAAHQAARKEEREAKRKAREANN